jgi:glucan biosynthesis protein C
VYQPSPEQFSSPCGRHYGMDWLRIGAFALLIFYHIGMVFSPWSWVIKAPQTYPALIPPMAFLTPWRLALLFAVSGFASRKLLDRSPGLGAFLSSRNRRLLVPLSFAMCVIVPIEMWVRVRGGGYGQDFIHFWAQDYWRAGEYFGIAFPSWEHLWFVAYLWAYTVVLAAVLMCGARSEALVAWMMAGRRLLWVPIVTLATVKLALLFVVPETQGLFTDWAGHAEYGPLFAFGFILAGAPSLWRTLARIFPLGIAVAAVAGAVVIGVEWSFPGKAIPGHAVMAADRIARIAMAWSMTCVLFHAATRWLNREHPWRGALARAVFPAYILHHPVIIVAAYWSLAWHLGTGAEFALLVVAAIGASAAGYAIGRRVGWIGTVIGLPPAARKARVISVAGVPDIG